MKDISGSMIRGRFEQVFLFWNSRALLHTLVPCDKLGFMQALSGGPFSNNNDTNHDHDNNDNDKHRNTQ